jgi:hypothetical protein
VGFVNAYLHVEGVEEFFTSPFMVVVHSTPENWAIKPNIQYFNFVELCERPKVNK